MRMYVIQAEFHTANTRLQFTWDLGIFFEMDLCIRKGSKAKILYSQKHGLYKIDFSKRLKITKIKAKKENKSTEIAALFYLVFRRAIDTQKQFEPVTVFAQLYSVLC